MTTTVNKGYELQVTGSNSGVWGDTLNDDVFTIVDSNLGGTVSKTLSSSNVTLSSTEAQNGIVRLIGTLSANVTVTTPVLGFFYVENATTGDYTVTMQYTGGVGTTIKPMQGMTTPVISDGTNGLRYGSSGLPPGTIIDYGGSRSTAWTGEYLYCDGSAVSRTTYSALFQAIGTTWGTGDGSTTFNVPDFRGRVTVGRDDMGGSTAGRITSAGSGITGTTLGATGGSQAITLDATMIPAHTHSGGSFVISSSGTSSVANVQLNTSQSTVNVGSTNAIPIVNSGGITVNSTGTVTSGASGSYGTSGSHINVQPSGIVNKLIKL